MKIKCNVESPWRPWKTGEAEANFRYLEKCDRWQTEISAEIQRWEDEAQRIGQIIHLLKAARNLNRMEQDEVKAKNYAESEDSPE